MTTPVPRAATASTVERQVRAYAYWWWYRAHSGEAPVIV